MRANPSLLAFSVVFAATGCAPPDTSELFHTMDLSVVGVDDPDDGPDAAAEPFIALVESAEDTLHVALPDGAHAATFDALLSAVEDRGIYMEVVVDYDNRDDENIARLDEAGARVRYLDDGITYFDFNALVDVGWTSDMVRMSDAWVVADSQRVVTATSFGTTDPGARVVMSLTGETLVTDLLMEHNQLFGGTDATAVTAFDNPSKNITDPRYAYPIDDDAVLEMWFGPQERLLKRVIDAVYFAKGNVKVLTNDFSNDGLAKALEDKAEWDFDMRAVVGPDLRTANQFQAQTLLDADGVEVRQVDVARVPTVVIIDDERDQDGRNRARAYILTHDLYSANRTFNAREVVTDQLIDGTLWVLEDHDERTPAFQALVDLWEAHAEQGEAL